MFMSVNMYHVWTFDNLAEACEATMMQGDSTLLWYNPGIECWVCIPVGRADVVMA